MPKFHDEWIVLPHDRLEAIEPELLTVTGQIPMPLGNFPRRMTVIGLPRRRSAIWSPIALPEKAMRTIEALGQPAYLIVPNGSHRLDLRPFHTRYPKAKIVTAKGAVKAVSEVAKATVAPAAMGKNVELVPLDGCGEGELAAIVTTAAGVTILTNDVIGNVAHPKGLGARIMARLMGFGPKPRITRPAKMMFIKDKKKLAAQLRDWATIPGLKRIIPSHGDIIRNPVAVLGRIADSLED